MKMTGFIVILLAGLVVCGCLIYRHQHRNPTGAAFVVLRRADDLRAVEASQPNVTFVPPGNLYCLVKLRREEEKQKPQEGRN